MSFCPVTRDLGLYMAGIDQDERDERALEAMKESLLDGSEFDTNEVQEVFAEAMFEDVWPALLSSYRANDDLAFMRSLRGAVQKRIDHIAANKLERRALAA